MGTGAFPLELVDQPSLSCVSKSAGIIIPCGQPCCMYCCGICSCGSTAVFGGGLENGIVFVPSGNSWSGWKFSHNDWDIGGEFRVTKNRSGGVAGIEYPAKGEFARVPPREGILDGPRDIPVGRNWSVGFRIFGELSPPRLLCWATSLDGVTEGV